MSDDVERLNLLGYDGLTIRQVALLPRLSEDALLLADFAHPVETGGRIIDLGTGLAPIPLFLSLKTEADIVGVELLEQAVSLARQAVEDNGLNHQITIMQGDIREPETIRPAGSVDDVIANPPYFRIGDHRLPDKGHAHRIAKHEVTVTFETIVRCAAHLLKKTGRFTFIQRMGRWNDVHDTLDDHGFHVTRIRWVHPRPGQSATWFMIEAVRHPHVTTPVTESPFYVYGRDGHHTDEYTKIMMFGRDRFETDTPL